MTILDRLYLVSYFRQYLIVLSSLLSLYVVVDLFTNLNDFTSGKSGFGAVLNHIVGYYSVQVLLIFDRLSEAITLNAALFTVALMQRNNELLPQLSAGVPTRRVIRPILLGGLITTSFGPLVNEFVIPRYADILTVPRDDPELRKPTVVRGGFDPVTGAHVVAEQAFRRELKVTKFEFTSAPVGDAEPTESPGAAVAGTGLLHLTAGEAFYVPPVADDPRSGGWKLFNAVPAEKPEASQTLPRNLRHLDHGQYFLKTDVSFDTVTRRASWYIFAPTSQLWTMLNELQQYTKDENFKPFYMFIPLLGLYFMLIKVPEQVAKAKQMAGSRNPLPANIVMYIFLSYYALAKDLNEVWDPQSQG